MSPSLGTSQGSFKCKRCHTVHTVVILYAAPSKISEPAQVPTHNRTRLCRCSYALNFLHVINALRFVYSIRKLTKELFAPVMTSVRCLWTIAKTSDQPTCICRKTIRFAVAVLLVMMTSRRESTSRLNDPSWTVLEATVRVSQCKNRCFFFFS